MFSDARDLIDPATAAPLAPAANPQHDLAIEVSGLSKLYKIYSRPSDLIREFLTGRPHHADHWALRDISFKVRSGEVIGIVGRNGAGKSTLLRILAGTLTRTGGDVRINGRISAILELGTGFQPHYTGRENIYVGGLCAGLSRQEVAERLGWIIDFSELADVIDQPFRTYSSGMQARLTFATAISINPDIMIVDEALAAGDLAFVQKCLGRIEEIIRGGSTVLLVSHNTNMITRFAQRALWIERGKLVADGDSEKIAKDYEISCYAQDLRQAPEAIADTVGDQRVRITHVKMEGESASDNVFIQGTPVKIILDVDSSIDTRTANFFVLISRPDMIFAWTATNHSHLDQQMQAATTPLEICRGRNRVVLEIPMLQLNSGTYHLNVGIEPRPETSKVSDYHDYKPRCLRFAVVRRDRLVLTKVFDGPSRWRTLARP